MAKIANVALTNTFDTWRSRSNEAFDRLSQFAINNSSLYANTLTSNVAFTAKGTATVTGLFTASGRAVVGTNLGVSGNTTLGAAGKTQTSTGVWSHTGNLTVSGNTTVSGLKANNSLGSTGYFLRTNGSTAYWDALPPSTQYLQVANAVTTYTTKSNPTTSGLWAHTGRATISTNLTVSGNTAFGAANKTSNTTGWFGVTGRATISTNLFVGGNTTLNGTTIDKSNTLAQTLTDGATINWDVSLGRVATVTLGAAGRTMAAPTNLKVGTYILRVYQDATGSRTITTWNSVFKWTAAVAPVLSTGANKLDIITFFSDGTNLYGSYLPDMR